jgi:hypothetical protein
VALTLVAFDMVTTQLPVPEQPPPLQPMNAVPKAGRAVRVTVVPLEKLATQVAPQLIPAGALVTVPLPVPAIVMASEEVVGTIAKVAVTLIAPPIVTTHTPVPVQPPLQPVKVEPAAGVAVSVIVVPAVYEAEQALPQLMPAGVLVMLPLPTRVRLKGKVRGVNVAVTVVAADIVTVQAPVPEQPPPLQPVKLEVGSGVAVSVTDAPLGYEAEQTLPQPMPAGLLVTVPAPAPVLALVSGTFGVNVTVRLRLTLLPAASRAVTVSVFVPGCRAIPLADQLVVPVAVPLPPALVVQDTWVTPTLSEAVPLSASELVVVAWVVADVGVVMARTGAVVSAADPPPTGVFISFRISAADRARL